MEENQLSEEIKMFFTDAMKTNKVYVLAEGENIILLPSNEYFYEEDDEIDAAEDAEEENLDAEDDEDAEISEDAVPFRVMPVWSENLKEIAAKYGEGLDVVEMELSDFVLLVEDFEDEEDLLIGPNWDENGDGEELFPEQILTGLSPFIEKME